MLPNANSGFTDGNYDANAAINFINDGTAVTDVTATNVGTKDVTNVAVNSLSIAIIFITIIAIDITTRSAGPGCSSRSRTLRPTPPGADPASREAAAAAATPLHFGQSFAQILAQTSLSAKRPSNYYFTPNFTTP